MKTRNYTQVWLRKRMRKIAKNSEKISKQIGKILGKFCDDTSCTACTAIKNNIRAWSSSLIRLYDEPQVKRRSQQLA